MKRILGVLAGLALTATALLTAPASGASTAVNCQTERVPVSVTALGTHTISGVLCLPAGAPPATVQILVPGSTYSHVYWDFPIDGYSYARSAAAAGQATFAIDRFNTGGSDRLPSALVTVDVDADTIHQLDTLLRAGDVGGTSFQHVALVGHSYGSIAVIEEAARYHDADGVVLTGFSHAPSPGFIAGIATGQIVIPAQLASPRLADRPLGDVSTPPGARLKYFYAPGDYDPAVVAEDEATKDVLTAGELATFGSPEFGVQSSLIHAPVLIANGTDDQIFYCGLTPCSSAAQLKSFEAPRFTGAASLDTYVLPGSGHDINLASNHALAFSAVQQWVSAHVG